MSEKTYLLDFKDRQAWRSWLKAHHTTESEAWLVIQKQRSALSGLSLNEVVEEALCFGRIDKILNTRFHFYSIKPPRVLVGFIPKSYPC